MSEAHAEPAATAPGADPGDRTRAVPPDGARRARWTKRRPRSSARASWPSTRSWSDRRPHRWAAPRPWLPTTGSSPRTASWARRSSAASTWSSTSPSIAPRGTAGCGTRCGTGSRWSACPWPASCCTPSATPWARSSTGGQECAIAYFGDGATSQGDFHEACNFAGVFRAPVVFFCQNNQWAISVPLAKQTAAPIHRKAEAYGFPGVRVDGNDVAAVYAAVREAADAGPRRRRPDADRGGDVPDGRALDGRRRHALPARGPACGVARRRSPGAGEGRTDLRPGWPTSRSWTRWTPRRRRSRPGPARAWCRWTRAPPTSCSRGCTRTCPRTWRASATRSPAMAEITMARALNEALRRALAEDDRTLVFGEDVGKLGGVFRVTDGLQQEFGERRVFDTPLAESGIAGVSVGLAMAGWKPLVEMQFDAFSYPALNQVISHIAKYRNRSRGHVGMPIVIRIPFGGGIGAAERPLGLARDVLRAHRRAEGGRAVVGPRRVRAAARRHRLSRPGGLPGAEGAVLVEGGRRPRRRGRAADGRGADRARGLGLHGRRVRRDGGPGARRGRAGGRARARRSR